MKRIRLAGVCFLAAVPVALFQLRATDEPARTPITAEQPEPLSSGSMDDHVELVDNKPSFPHAPDALGDLFDRFEDQPTKAVSQLAFHSLHAASKGQPVQIQLPGMDVEGIVDSLLRRDGVRDYGVTLADGTGRMVVSVTDAGFLLAHVFFHGETRAFRISGSAQTWAMEATTISEIYCAPPGQTYPLEASAGIEKDPALPTPNRARSQPLLAPPILNSLPSSIYVIYCDFDGEVVTHPLWNAGNTINALPHPKANNESWVTAVWKRVAEDFSPFDINVTTDRARYDAADVGKRMHCIITPTTTASPGSGGVAFLFSFLFDAPCWTFNSTEYSAADTISHEVGHTLGLSHDGRNLPGGTKDTYYGGHGTGATSWSPIMGAAWSDSGPRQYDNVTQWSLGEYADADNTQNDLGIIAGFLNGFGYRVDDKSNFRIVAPDLQLAGDDILDSGIIERNADVDWFRFTTADGLVTIHADPIDVMSTEGESGSSTDGANLAIELGLYDAFGVLLETDNPATELSASVSRTLSAGTYYIRVNGADRGTVDTGFSNYASIGQYALTGTVPSGSPAPEISIQGGIGLHTLIPDGDMTPGADDGTDFGVTVVGGTPGERTFEIENTGTLPLLLGPVTEDSIHFSIVGTPPVSIAAGSSATFVVRFAPTANGVHTTTVTVLSNDTDEGIYTFAVQGEGSAVPVDDAYEENDTQPSSYDLTLQEGAWLSTISGFGIQADDDWFEILVSQDFNRVVIECDFAHAAGDIDIALYTGAGGLLAASTSTTDDESIVFDVAPTGGTYHIRVYSANNGTTYDLRWDDFAPPADAEIVIRGGSEFDFTVDDGDLSPTIDDGTDFGVADISGGVVDSVFQIENTGSDTLTISQISINSTEFAILPGYPAAVAAGASGTFTVRFDPVTAGAHTATVTVLNSDADEGLYDFAVEGEGTLGTIDDDYEENDSLGTAYDLTANEATLLSSLLGVGIQSDDDWYTIDVDPGINRVLIDCTFTHSEGDIDIALHNSAGNLLASSTGTINDEQIDALVAPTGGLHYIRVYFNNAGNTYDLQWDDLAPPPPDDNYEDNDLRTEAYDLRSLPGTWLSAIDGPGIQEDADWYRVQTTTGFEGLHVKCVFTNAHGNIDLSLHGAVFGFPFAGSATTNDTEEVLVIMNVAGTAYIRVQGDFAGSTYDLWWDALANDGDVDDDTLPDTFEELHGGDIHSLHPDDNLDSDPYPLWVEFALELSPTTNDGSFLFPYLQGNEFHVDYTRNKQAVAAGILFDLEETDNLNTGYSGTTATHVGTTDSGTTETLTHRCSTPSNTTCTVRLKLTRP